MKELSLLELKCLANMPTLLDTIVFTLNNLRDILLSIYDELEKFLKMECESVRYDIDSWERGVVYVMGDEDDFYNAYLENLISKTEIHCLFGIVQKRKKNPNCFCVEFGYLLNEKCNVIYFQIKNDNTQIDINTFFDSVEREIFSCTWDFSVEDDIVYIQFDVDETLSVDKIKKCAEDFKIDILKPFFSLLNT